MLGTIDYTWDGDRNLLTSVENKWDTGSGQVQISKYAYRYDSLGRRTDVVRTGDAFASSNLDLWTYNDRNELTDSAFYNDTDPCSPSNPDADNDRAYTYDPIGNRETYDEGTASTLYYCENELNQYIETDTQEDCPSPDETFSYDSDGNLTKDGTYRYIWNAENRLVRVRPKGAPQAGDVRITYVYDYLGRRVRKTVETHNGSSWVESADTKFVWYNWLMLLELDANAGDAVLRKYSWGLDLAGQAGSSPGGTGVSPVSLDAAGGIGGLVGVRNLGESPARSYIYFCDGNGNVVQAINRSSDTIDAQYEYDAYGNNLLDASDSNESGPFALDNPLRFSTRYYDGEHDDPATVVNEGTYSYIFRDYWPRLGRWGSRDPIGEAGGVNLYAHTSNMPSTRVDSLGREWISISEEWEAWLTMNPIERQGAYLFETNPLVWLIYFMSRWGNPTAKDAELSNDVGLLLFMDSMQFGYITRTVEAEAAALVRRIPCKPKRVISATVTGSDHGGNIVAWNNFRYVDPTTYVIQQFSYSARWACFAQKKCWCCKDGTCGEQSRVQCALNLTGWDYYDFHGNAVSDFWQKWGGGSFMFTWHASLRYGPVIRTHDCHDGTPAPGYTW